ncbi:hypothetical protein FACS189427_05980 [Planctomycetales bacterium]|nr:hypothetical protein FACS189427_05980 [Planctomycetales bacterium]
MRTSSVVIVSCVLGAGIGIGSAFCALTVNGWNPELEFKRHSDLVKEIALKAENPNAKASIENTVFDFGIRDVKDKGQCEFYIKNIGTANLTLEVNRTTCTCTGINLSAKNLAPGKTSVATLHYDAERATTGPYNQGGIIVTNDPEHREIYLSVKGIFTAPVVMNPGGVVFSSLHSSATQTAKVRIYGFEKKPLKLETPQWNDKEHFNFELKPSELNETDKQDSMNKNASSVYEGTVTVKPGLPIGTFQERFIIKTNYVSEPEFEFTAKGQVSGSSVSITGMSFNKDRGVLVMEKTVQGKPLKRDIMIQFTGSSATRVKLQKKNVAPEYLNITLTEPKDIGKEASVRRFYTLSVEVPANAPVGNFMKADRGECGIITLETGLAENPVIKIPVEFSVEE